VDAGVGIALQGKGRRRVVEGERGSATKAELIGKGVSLRRTLETGGGESAGGRIRGRERGREGGREGGRDGSSRRCTRR